MSAWVAAGPSSMNVPAERRRWRTAAQPHTSAAVCRRTVSILFSMHRYSPHCE